MSSRVYVRVLQERIYTSCIHTRARLDCENYVGKTTIRRRCNNLSWTASRVGGNYAELMRSSSCGPRIIYSESASLSPCITRSGFSAVAHVCFVSARNPRDTPRREINFPILPKRSRDGRGTLVCRKTATARRWQYTALWIGDYYMVLTGETIAILQGMLIEVNLSKSSRIAKSDTSQVQMEIRWKK